MNPLGLYFHVPFCDTLCPYCDFFKVRTDGDLMARYVDRCKTELQGLKPEPLCADSVYFGGGTPSVLPPVLLAELMASVRENISVTEDAEITVECNPSSNLEEFLPVAAEHGVNRISLGMQSAVTGERRKLGRRADRERVADCLRLARQEGIQNLTLDIMLGVPGQTMESLQETLRFLTDSGVPHVSAYMLKLEEGTPFAKRADKLNLPEEDLVTDLYLCTIETLEAAGLRQYEISNFARPGFESRHNLKYWHCEEYLGIGPAAHSFRNGKRYYTVPDLEAFCKGSEPVEDGAGGSFEERFMLALRLREGYTGALPENVRQNAAQAFLLPYLNREGNTLRLTKEGFLVSNAVIAELLKD